MFTMGQRPLLQQILETICENVYFQPPSNVQMEYPAIVYSRITAKTTFADNSPYRFTKQYQITSISRNPDDVNVDKIGILPMCKHERFYVVDGLNHDVFAIYF